MKKCVISLILVVMMVLTLAGAAWADEPAGVIAETGTEVIAEAETDAEVIVEAETDAEAETDTGANAEVLGGINFVAAGETGNLSWNIDSEGILTIFGQGEMPDYEFDWTSLVTSAPWGSKSDKITKVVVGENITSIGEAAFFGCGKIKSVEIPDSVKSIGDWAFSDCAGLESIKISSGINSVGNQAFQGCTGLGNVEIENGVSSIGSLAFDGCTGLSSIKIPESITEILDSTFNGCTGLASLELSGNVEKIDEYAFDGCTGLKDIYIGTKAQANALLVSQGNVPLQSATWHYADQRTVTYELNGGTNVAANPQVYYVSEVAEEGIGLQNPTRKGYTFAGWYADAGFKSKVVEIAAGSTSNVTFYAKWTANSYTIAFNANGGTGTMSPKSCLYGKKYTLTSNAFKKTGYTFTGWNTKKDGSGTALANKSKISNLTYKDKKTVTLYAQWSVVTYTITYDLNGGKNSKSNPATYTVNSKTITFATPTRTGYTFVGWYRDSSFKKSIKSISKGSTGNVKLYARWKLSTPASFKVRKTARTNKLSWKAVSGATGYIIYRKVSGSYKKVAVVKDKTYYVDSSVKSGKKYYYKIKAYKKINSETKIFSDYSTVSVTR